MWKDYAQSIGKGVDSLTQYEKIQAEVNGILSETRFQTGDAAKVAQSYSGQVSQLTFNFNNLKVAIGNALIPIVQAILPHINAMLSKRWTYWRRRCSFTGRDLKFYITRDLLSHLKLHLQKMW